MISGVRYTLSVTVQPDFLDKPDRTDAPSGHSGASVARQGMLRFALEMLIFEAVGLGNPTERVLRCATGDAPLLTDGASVMEENDRR